MVLFFTAAPPSMRALCPRVFDNPEGYAAFILFPHFSRVPPFDVFTGAYIDTVILTTCKAKPATSHAAKVFEYPKRDRIVSIDMNRLPIREVAQASWWEGADQKFVMDVGILTLLGRLGRSCALKLADCVEMKRGVLFNRSMLTRKKTEEQAHRYFEGDVYRYSVNFKAPRWVEYGPKMREYPKDFRWFKGERILLRRLVSRKRRLMASLIDKTVITNKNLYALITKPGFSTKYVLAIVNSRLLSRLYLAQVSQATKDDFPQVTIRDILALPAPGPPHTSTQAKVSLDHLVSLVDSMLSLHGGFGASRSTAQRESIQRQIDATDAEIDRLVYELYGLTEKEIGIVEGEQ
ncbi:MAG: TaqI-like C-terminal specificity domain-containing protein [Candidatus Eisenbacteria bacterium]